MLRASFIILTAALLLPNIAYADETIPLVNPVAVSALNQDRCISQMADFPTDDPTARYQFFKLVGDVAYGIDNQSLELFEAYGQPAVTEGTPILTAIEDIANPVLRMAAPEIMVSSMAYIVDFAQSCEIYILGQTESLIAFDPTLGESVLNTAVAEDALFLRQILSESLLGLGAERDPVWASAARNYGVSLIAQRDAVEYSAFDSEIAELETLFIDDLDGRLARSNDVINAEIDDEILREGVRISNDMTEAAEKQAKQQSLSRLISILRGGR